MDIKKFEQFNQEPDDDGISVYIVLRWFWEGDGYLVNSYEDCFLTENQAVNCANALVGEYSIRQSEMKKDEDDFLAKRNFYNEPLRIYKFDEPTPGEDEGGWGQTGFIQIIKKDF